MIATQTYRDELLALAAAIQTDNPTMLPWTAFDQAARMLPALLADVEADTRYVPCRVVMFEPFSARELMEWTDR